MQIQICARLIDPRVYIRYITSRKKPQVSRQTIFIQTTIRNVFTFLNEQHFKSGGANIVAATKSLHHGLQNILKLARNNSASSYMDHDSTSES